MKFLKIAVILVVIFNSLISMENNTNNNSEKKQSPITGRNLSHITGAGKRGSRKSMDFSGLRDSLNDLLKNEDKKSHSGSSSPLHTEKHTLMHEMVATKLRALSEAKQAEHSRECDTIYRESCHQAKMAIENIKIFRQVKNESESNALISVYYESFYNARNALVEKEQIEHHDYPLFRCEQHADEALQDLRKSFKQGVLKPSTNALECKKIFDQACNDAYAVINKAQFQEAMDAHLAQENIENYYNEYYKARKAILDKLHLENHEKSFELERQADELLKPVRAAFNEKIILKKEKKKE